jgi:hypothetical protein
VTPLRVLLGVLLLCNVAGTPGLGLETRAGGSALIGLLYFIPFASAVAALVGTWRWPRSVRWLAWVASISTVILAVGDLGGLTDPERPPAAVAALEIAAIILSLGILYRTRASIATRA